MSGLDFLLICIYLICIAFVFVQMISSLFVEEVEIIFNKNDLQSQLESQLLQEAIQIDFNFQSRYKLNTIPSTLQIGIRNTSANKWIYIEWDYSCFIDLTGQATRLVRVPPGSTFDLLPSQMFTVLSPGTQFREILTSEASLKRDAETDFLTIGSALINVSQFKPTKKKNLILPEVPEEPGKFYIRLGIRSANTNEDNSRTFYILNCMFLVKAVHWKQQLPWN